MRRENDPFRAPRAWLKPDISVNTTTHKNKTKNTDKQRNDKQQDEEQLRQTAEAELENPPGKRQKLGQPTFDNLERKENPPEKAKSMYGASQNRPSKMTPDATPSPTQQDDMKARQPLEPRNNTTVSEGQGLDGLTTIQSKYSPVFRGWMRPDPSISHHPAYATLFQYTTEGCPVDCGAGWSKEHLEAAIQRGPHASAKSPEAA